MTQYKCIALDMDGTTFNNQKIISDENVKWIRRASASGFHVVFSTGRPIRGVTPHMEQLGLSMPIVVNNGSEVWRSPAELYARKTMDGSDIEQVYQLAKPCNVRLWAHTVEGTYRNELFPQQFDSINWLQVGLYTEEEELRHKLRTELTGWNRFEISNSHAYNLELNALGISKASGLRTVCELLGIQMSEIVAAGDSLNDIAMISEAGIGVAMGNAQEEVKRFADWIAPSNQEDGVACIIRRFFFE